MTVEESRLSDLNDLAKVLGIRVDNETFWVGRGEKRGKELHELALVVAQVELINRLEIIHRSPERVYKVLVHFPHVLVVNWEDDVLSSRFLHERLFIAWFRLLFNLFGYRLRLRRDLSLFNRLKCEFFRDLNILSVDWIVIDIYLCILIVYLFSLPVASPKGFSAFSWAKLDPFLVKLTLYNVCYRSLIDFFKVTSSFGLYILEI